MFQTGFLVITASAVLIVNAVHIPEKVAGKIKDHGHHGEHKEGARSANLKNRAENDEEGMDVPSYCPHDFTEANPGAKMGDFEDAMMRCQKTAGVTPIKPMVYQMAKEQLGLPDGSLIWTDAKANKWKKFTFRYGKGGFVKNADGDVLTLRRKKFKGKICVAFDTRKNDFVLKSCDRDLYLACDSCDNTGLLDLLKSPTRITVKLTFDTDIDIDLAALDSGDVCETWYEDRCAFNGNNALVSGGQDRWGGDGHLGERLVFQGDFGDGMDNTPYLIAALNYNNDEETFASANGKVMLKWDTSPDYHVVRPANIGRHSYSIWLIGCVNPAAGIASWKELNTYADEMPDSVADICSEDYSMHGLLE